MTAELIKRVRERLAETAVGASTMRGHGAGVVAAARRALKGVDLEHLAAASREQFQETLDAETERLRKKLPPGSRSWGAARKVINIFLRDCLYNRYLSRHFRLARLERWLEVPLDSQVAGGIRCSAVADALPRWPGVKHLKPEVSAAYQAAAERIAKANKIARVHLDLYWWRQAKPP